MSAQEIIPSGIALELTQKDNLELLDTLLVLLSQINKKMPRLDSADRMQIISEASLTVSGSLSSVTTITTVTTVANATNLNNFAGGNTAGIPFQLSQMGANHIYDKIVIS